MKKITRKNLDELMVSMPIISEIQQKTYIGGGDGSPNNPYTVEQYDFLCSIGVWQGGYVEGWGYTSPEVIINGGNSGSWGGGTLGTILDIGVMEILVIMEVIGILAIIQV